MLRHLIDPAAAAVDAHRFGGQELRPVWAAAGDDSAIAAPAATAKPAPVKPAGAETPPVRPAVAERPPAARAATPTARDKLPATRDLETAFDQDVASTAPATTRTHDLATGPGSQRRG